MIDKSWGGMGVCARAEAQSGLLLFGGRLRVRDDRQRGWRRLKVWRKSANRGVAVFGFF